MKITLLTIHIKNKDVFFHNKQIINTSLVFHKNLYNYIIYLKVFCKYVYINIFI